MENVSQRLHQIQTNLNQSQKEFGKTHEDYADVIDSHDEIVPAPAALAVMQHRDAASLMYHMGNNPDFVLQLQQMEPLQQQVAIGELAASLRSGSPRVSKAPSPGRPVGSTPGSATEPPTDTDAYMKWAEKHMR